VYGVTVYTRYVNTTDVLRGGPGFFVNFFQNHRDEQRGGTMAGYIELQYRALLVPGP
jgi:hypothetical protein